MKNVLLLITMFFLISCSSNETKKETTNTKLVTEYFNYFNNHDWVKMAEMYADEAEFKDPSLGVGIIKQTQDQVIEKYQQLNAVFTDIKDEVIAVYPSGEKYIIVEFISTGTAPDGTKFELPICTIFTIENNKITQDFSYFDNFEE